MDTPDLTSYRRAERLEWRALTVFDGDRGGDGNVDGVLHAINGDQVLASLPLDIFTRATWDSLHHLDTLRGREVPSGSWVPNQDNPMGMIIADPRTRDAVQDEIRQWCRQECGRDDVTVKL